MMEVGREDPVRLQPDEWCPTALLRKALRTSVAGPALRCGVYSAAPDVCLCTAAPSNSSRSCRVTSLPLRARRRPNLRWRPRPPRRPPAQGGGKGKTATSSATTTGGRRWCLKRPPRPGPSAPPSPSPVCSPPLPDVRCLGSLGSGDRPSPGWRAEGEVRNTATTRTCHSDARHSTRFAHPPRCIARRGENKASRARGTGNSRRGRGNGRTWARDAVVGRRS